MSKRVLVLPGIGDVYWVAVAMRAWMAKHGIQDAPTLDVWDFDGRRRSLEFIERLEFVKAGAYFDKPPHPFKLPEFQDTYHTGARSDVAGFLGYDHYLAVNGALVNGRTIADALGVDPDALDWYPTLRRTPADLEAEGRYVARFGRYCVLHFSAFGMFKHWVKAWDVHRCAEFILEAEAATGLTMVLTGSEWDRPLCAELAEMTGAVNLAGETNAEEFYGILHGAAAVAGWCGGNTILATALRVPTLILWSEKHFPNAGFYRTSCPPDSFGKRYQAGTVERTTPRDAVDLLTRALAYA